MEDGSRNMSQAFYGSWIEEKCVNAKIVTGWGEVAKPSQCMSQGPGMSESTYPAYMTKWLSFFTGSLMNRLTNIGVGPSPTYPS